MSPSVGRKIELHHIASATYVYKDLDKATTFLLDFGFSVVEKRDDRIFFRGYGTEPYVFCARKGDADAFGGVTFAVESIEDLELASRTLPNATEVHDVDAPGGGKGVTFYEPIDNVAWHLVHGQTPAEMTDTFPELSYNFPTQKHRPVNKTQRFTKGPAPVHKLGHFGLCLTDFKKAYEFYLQNFNFKPSELVHNDKGEDITTFCHLDRPGEWVDHHSFFFFEGPKPHVHHTSYETFDFDTQLLGHHWLRQKGYDNCWGVGRHVMGSQIFDYWFDPSRFIMEHYVDGDLVNEETPVNRTKAAPDNLHVWGPDLPADFLQ